ncbi:glycosyltransferase family 9 protein [Lonsdalea quercina]|uniref:glycosyltransferase family 9 protein n=1 Tax=Lonsdalea quercina TaxID=71657 RepID=UPI003974967F
MKEVYFDGMHGIGDNIMQRCFIKQLAQRNHEIWLKTPVPEIYQGISNLHFVKADTPLRTQKKNENKTKVRFEPVPPGIDCQRIFYGDVDMQQGTIFTTMERQFGIPPADLDLPHYALPDIGIPTNRPLAVIRPTTVRTEWFNASRGPLNEYVDSVARILADKGWHVVSIADNEPGQEWIPDVEPFAHQKLHHGELTITQMLALVEQADMVVCGVGVVMLAALAYRRPMIGLQGGCGGSNHHSKVTDRSCMDLSQAIFIYPDNYCRCQLMKHKCNKFISNLPSKVTPFIERMTAAYQRERSCEMI